MRYFLLEGARTPHYSGTYVSEHRWYLPGVHCPVCGAIWSTTGDAYPSVDLSHLPEAEKYSARLEKSYSEFERLREQVRPLAPPGVHLWPGTQFGPMTGAAQGEFGPFTLYNPWELLMSREAVTRVLAEGVTGLKGCRVELRFRKKSPPDLLELELLPRGRLHRDCLPPDLAPPCGKCGRQGFTLPEEPILEASSLPTELDLFRLAGFSTLIIGTERFVETTRRLGYEQDLRFRELPTR